MAEADQRDLLPHIAVPTLLIWGELDARSPLSVARQFEQAIPDAKLVVIPGCGHVSNLEQPDSSTRPCARSAARILRVGREGAERLRPLPLQFREAPLEVVDRLARRPLDGAADEQTVEQPFRALPPFEVDHEVVGEAAVRLGEVLVRAGRAGSPRWTLVYSISR